MPLNVCNVIRERSSPTGPAGHDGLSSMPFSAAISPPIRLGSRSDETALEFTIKVLFEPPIILNGVKNVNAAERMRTRGNRVIGARIGVNSCRLLRWRSEHETVFWRSRRAGTSFRAIDTAAQAGASETFVENDGIQNPRPQSQGAAGCLFQGGGSPLRPHYQRHISYLPNIRFEPFGSKHPPPLSSAACAHEDPIQRLHYLPTMTSRKILVDFRLFFIARSIACAAT